jgi:peptidyl-prolyl cis-trans isomerase B (cyclophilin B)
MKKLSRVVVAICLLVVGGAMAGCQQSTEPVSQPTGLTVTCAYPAAGQAAKPVSPPQTTGVSVTGTVQVTLHMVAGDVVLTLTRAGVPCAVNSFVSLVDQHYFDNTKCHRLATDFVLQCGDPLGTGSGGPGYSFKDELSGNETYPYGTVAMANAGPDTNGSQFFIVIGQSVQLPPKYDVLGSVSPDSMAVIESIAQQGVSPDSPQPNDGPPVANTTITSATVD